MSGISLFLKKNKIQKKNAKYAATKSLCDENGNPLEWEIRAISTIENEKLRESCTVEVQVPGKPNLFRPRVLTGKYVAALLAASVVYPDLQNKELQDSYGAMTPEELIQLMVDDPVEYNDFAEFVQNFSGLDSSMQDKIDVAKN